MFRQTPGSMDNADSQRKSKLDASSEASKRPEEVQVDDEDSTTDAGCDPIDSTVPQIPVCTTDHERGSTTPSFSQTSVCTTDETDKTDHGHGSTVASLPQISVFTTDETDGGPGSTVPSFFLASICSTTDDSDDRLVIDMADVSVDTIILDLGPNGTPTPGLSPVSDSSFSFIRESCRDNDCETESFAVNPSRQPPQSYRETYRETSDPSVSFAVHPSRQQPQSYHANYRETSDPSVSFAVNPSRQPPQQKIDSYSEENTHVSHILEMESILTLSPESSRLGGVGQSWIADGGEESIYRLSIPTDPSLTQPPSLCAEIDDLCVEFHTKVSTDASPSSVDESQHTDDVDTPTPSSHLDSLVAADGDNADESSRRSFGSAALPVLDDASEVADEWAEVTAEVTVEVVAEVTVSLIRPHASTTSSGRFRSAQVDDSHDTDMSQITSASFGSSPNGRAQLNREKKDVYSFTSDDSFCHVQEHFRRRRKVNYTMAPAAPRVESPSTLQPNSSIIKPKTCTLQPKMCTLQPNSSIIKPKTCTLQSNPTTIQPDTCTLQPNTSTIKPNTCTLQPNPSTIHPDTCTLQPNTSTIKPNTCTLQPNPSTIHLDTCTLSNQSTINLNKRTLQPMTSGRVPRSAQSGDTTTRVKEHPGRPVDSSPGSAEKNATAVYSDLGSESVTTRHTIPPTDDLVTSLISKETALPTPKDHEETALLTPKDPEETCQKLSPSSRGTDSTSSSNVAPVIDTSAAKQSSLDHAYASPGTFPARSQGPGRHGREERPSVERSCSVDGLQVSPGPSGLRVGGGSRELTSLIDQTDQSVRQQRVLDTTFTVPASSSESSSSPKASHCPLALQPLPPAHQCAVVPTEQSALFSLQLTYLLSASSTEQKTTLQTQSTSQTERSVTAQVQNTSPTKQRATPLLQSTTPTEQRMTPQLQNTSPKTPQLQNTPQKTPQLQNTSPKTPQLQNTSPKTPQLQNTSPKTPQLQNTFPKTQQLQNTFPKTPQLQNTFPKTPKLQNTFPKTPQLQNTYPITPQPQNTSAMTSKLPSSPQTELRATPRCQEHSRHSVTAPHPRAKSSILYSHLSADSQPQFRDPHSCHGEAPLFPDEVHAHSTRVDLLGALKGQPKVPKQPPTPYHSPFHSSRIPSHSLTEPYRLSSLTVPFHLPPSVPPPHAPTEPCQNRSPVVPFHLLPRCTPHAPPTEPWQNLSPAGYFPHLPPRVPPPHALPESYRRSPPTVPFHHLLPRDPWHRSTVLQHPFSSPPPPFYPPAVSPLVRLSRSPSPQQQPPVHFYGSTAHPWWYQSEKFSFQQQQHPAAPYPQQQHPAVPYPQQQQQQLPAVPYLHYVTYPQQPGLSAAGQSGQSPLTSRRPTTARVSTTHPWSGSPSSSSPHQPTFPSRPSSLYPSAIMPTHHVAMPSHQSVMPSHQSAMPTHPSAMTSHQSAMPPLVFVGSTHPSAMTSYQSTMTPHTSAMSSHQSAMPSHQSSMPSHQSAVPSNSPAMTSHQSAMPSHQSAMPSNPPAMTSHQTAMPSHPSAIPPLLFVGSTHPPVVSPNQSTMTSHQSAMTSHKSATTSQQSALPSHHVARTSHRSAMQSQQQRASSAPLSCPAETGAWPGGYPFERYEPLGSSFSQDPATAAAAAAAAAAVATAAAAASHRSNRDTPLRSRRSNSATLLSPCLTTRLQTLLEEDEEDEVIEAGALSLARPSSTTSLLHGLILKSPSSLLHPLHQASHCAESTRLDARTSSSSSAGNIPQHEVSEIVDSEDEGDSHDTTMSATRVGSARHANSTVTYHASADEHPRVETRSSTTLETLKPHTSADDAHQRGVVKGAATLYPRRAGSSVTVASSSSSAPRPEKPVLASHCGRDSSTSVVAPPPLRDREDTSQRYNDPRAEDSLCNFADFNDESVVAAPAAAPAAPRRYPACVETQPQTNFSSSSDGSGEETSSRKRKQHHDDSHAKDHAILGRNLACQPRPPRRELPGLAVALHSGEAAGGKGKHHDSPTKDLAVARRSAEVGARSPRRGGVTSGLLSRAVAGPREAGGKRKLRDSESASSSSRGSADNTQLRCDAGGAKKRRRKGDGLLQRLLGVAKCGKGDATTFIYGDTTARDMSAAVSIGRDTDDTSSRLASAPRGQPSDSVGREAVLRRASSTARRQASAVLAPASLTDPQLDSLSDDQLDKTVTELRLERGPDCLPREEAELAVYLEHFLQQNSLSLQYKMTAKKGKMMGKLASMCCVKATRCRGGVTLTKTPLSRVPVARDVTWLAYCG